MRYTTTLRRSILILLMLAGWVTSLQAQQQSPFQPLDHQITSLQPDLEVLHSQPIQVDLDLLARLKTGDVLEFNLTPDQPLTGIIQRAEFRTPLRFTLAGRLDQHMNGSFIIVVYDDVAVGVIRPLTSGLLYRIRYTSEGLHLIDRIDSSLYPPEQCYHDSGTPSDHVRVLPITAPHDPSGPDSDRGGCSPLPPVYDLLIAYTHLARQSMGSTNAAIAQCQLAVEVGNQAYANSQIDVHLRLAHTMEVNFDEDGDMSDWLDWVTANTAIAQVRSDYGADFVNLFTSAGSGIGWCGPGVSLAYSCARWDRAVTTWTLVHEMGHNQGCDHNREDTDGSCAYYDYAFGHHYMDTFGDTRGTVMSYIGIRIAHFSNPDVEFNGYPTGVPIGEEGEAHCAHLHNVMDYTCEQFRVSRYDVWVDFDHTGAENGSFNLPFDTAAEGAANIVNGVGATEIPTLWIKSGETNETVTISTPMLIQACGGLVTIGN